MMKTNKHIAMWCCRRSRSTVTVRSFEQLDRCVIYDSPFYPPYIFAQGSDKSDKYYHPHSQGIIEAFETDYKKVIEKLVGDLPSGVSFSFQRHIIQNTLPLFFAEQEWLKHINHFFLIRNPQEMILSHQELHKKMDIKQEITLEDIGIKTLYGVFKDVESLTGKTPLVIDSADLAKNPGKTLKFICEYFQIDFSEKMLSWKPGLQDSILTDIDPSTSKESLSAWYSNVMNSDSFLPYEEKKINFPDELMPLFQDCLPFYKKLAQHRQVIS